MRYTVRKGLESPCMIRGFLSSLPLLPVLGHKLRKKARPTKFRESKYGMTVSNLTINRQLLKKKQDERGRGIQHT